MQKSINKILALTFSIAVLFSSCSKAPSKILPKKDGLWTISYTTVTVVGGAQSTQTGAYTATFKDGTFTITQGLFSFSGTWSYDKKNKVVIVALTGYPSQSYNVEEMKSKSEKWTYKNSSTSGGVVTTIDETWTLTKL